MTTVGPRLVGRDAFAGQLDHVDHREAMRMLTGPCHSGAVRWTLAGEPGSIAVCNCTLCRRYGVLWAYDYENERIRISNSNAT